MRFDSCGVWRRLLTTSPGVQTHTSLRRNQIPRHCCTGGADGAAGDGDAIQARIKRIRAQVEEISSDYVCEKVQERVAKLAGGRPRSACHGCPPTPLRMMHATRARSGFTLLLEALVLVPDADVGHAGATVRQRAGVTDQRLWRPLSGVVEPACAQVDMGAASTCAPTARAMSWVLYSGRA